MKFPRLLVALLLASGFPACLAQEKIAAEKLLAISHKLIASLGGPMDAPVKIDPDPEKSDGFTAHEAGAVVVPDKNLSSAALEKAGAKTIPLGHLFFKDLAPIKEGKAAPADQLRTLTITARDQEYRITNLMLGLRKREDQWELAVYGKQDTPLLQLPLKKLDREKQDLPVELSGEKQDDNTGLLSLAILGRYKATLPVKAAD